MTDIRRVTLNSAPPAEKEKKVKKSPVTFRFVLALGESNATSCPEFSFTDLVKGEKVKHPISENPLDDRSNDAEVARIAQQFEAKYGGKPFKSGGKKRTQDMDDYFDLGEGYDTEDSFIDNTEAYDEVIPSTLTTKHGGYYINQGKLDFRSLSDDSNDDFQQLEHKKKKKKNIIESDSEEETGEDLHKRFKAMKRKKLLESKQGEKKRKKLMPGVNGEVIKKKKKKKSLDLQKRKITLPVKPALEAKTIPTNTPTQSTSPNVPATVSSSAVNSSVTSTSAVVSLGAEVKPTTSVASAASPVNNPPKPENNAISKSQEDVTCIQNLCSSILEEAMKDEDSSKSDDEEKRSTEKIRKLPHQLPSELVEAIEVIKKEAKESKEGKSKFFSDDINKLLLNIEKESLKLTKWQRSAVFNHLSDCLPSGKNTLLRRAKKLREEEEEEAIIGKLKTAISKVMPALKEQYEKDVVRLRLESKSELAEATKEEASTESEEEEGKTDTKKVVRRRARRKFQWTPEIRELFHSIVQLKMKKYDASKSKNQQSEEDYMKSFLESDIKSIWPKGWMNTRLLYKVAKSSSGDVTITKDIITKGVKPKKTLGGKTSPVTEATPLHHISRKEDVIEISSILDDDIEEKKNVVINLCDKSTDSNQYSQKSVSLLGAPSSTNSNLLSNARIGLASNTQTPVHSSASSNEVKSSTGAFVSKSSEKVTVKLGSIPDPSPKVKPPDVVEILDSPSSSPVLKKVAHASNSVYSSAHHGFTPKAPSLITPQSSSTPKMAVGLNSTPSSSTPTLNSSQSFLQAFNHYLNQTQSKGEEVNTNKSSAATPSSQNNQLAKSTGNISGFHSSQKKTQQQPSQPEKISPPQSKILSPISSAHPSKVSQDYVMTNPLPKGVLVSNGRNSHSKSPVVTMNRVSIAGTSPIQKQQPVTYTGSKGLVSQTQKPAAAAAIRFHTPNQSQAQLQNSMSQQSALSLKKKNQQQQSANANQPANVPRSFSNFVSGNRTGVKPIHVSPPGMISSSTKQGVGSGSKNMPSPIAKLPAASSSNNLASSAQRKSVSSITTPTNSQIKSGIYLGTSVSQLCPQQQQLKRQQLQQKQQHSQMKTGAMLGSRSSNPLTVRTSPISPSSPAANKSLSPSNSLIHSASLSSTSRTSTPSPQNSPGSNPLSVYDRIQSQIRNQEATEKHALEALAKVMNFDSISTPKTKHLTGRDAGNSSSGYR